MNQTVNAICSSPLFALWALGKFTIKLPKYHNIQAIQAPPYLRRGLNCVNICYEDFLYAGVQKVSTFVMLNPRMMFAIYSHNDNN